MDTLIKKFGSKAALARALHIKPEAVYNAFRRGNVPTSWLPVLLQNGFSKAQLLSLPIDKKGRRIVSVLNSRT